MCHVRAFHRFRTIRRRGRPTSRADARALCGYAERERACRDGADGADRGGERRRAADRRADRPQPRPSAPGGAARSEERTSELQSLMRISYAVFCLKKKKKLKQTQPNTTQLI